MSVTGVNPPRAPLGNQVVVCRSTSAEVTLFVALTLMSGRPTPTRCPGSITGISRVINGPWIGPGGKPSTETTTLSVTRVR